MGFYFYKMTRKEKCELAIKQGFVSNEITGQITTKTGIIASKKAVNGYILLTIRDEQRKAYYLLAHQFVWYCKYKETVKCIDHINQIKTDNSISNLRSVSKSQNAMNMKNVKGYTFCSRSKRYIAMIMVNYKSKQLGFFKTPEEARNCYLENKNKYHIINN